MAVSNAQSDFDTPATSDPQLNTRMLQVCEAIGDFIEYWGFRAIHGRIWTLLVLRRSPMSQSELARELGVSRALVSTAMSELSGYGLVRAVEDRRQSPYEAVLDVWSTVADVLRSREWMMLEKIRVALEGAIDENEVFESDGTKSKYDKSRLRLLLTMTEVAQKLLRLLIGVRRPTGSQRVDHWIKRAVQMARQLNKLL